MKPERTCLALKTSPPADTGVKALEQQRLTRKKIQTTLVGGYRHADAEILKQEFTLLWADVSVIPDGTKSVALCHI